MPPKPNEKEEKKRLAQFEKLTKQVKRVHAELKNPQQLQKHFQELEKALA